MILGIIYYTVQYGGTLSSGETLNCTITVLNHENMREKFTAIPYDAEGLSGVVKIENVKLWWPYLMNENPGYMYTLEVKSFVYIYSYRLIDNNDLYIIPNRLVYF